MMLRFLLAALAAYGALGLALGQGSGSTAPPKERGDSAFLVTKTVKGSVVEPPSRDELVVEVNGRRLTLRINTETTLKADKGADVNDPSNVSAADLKKGQPVRIKYRPADETAVEIRVLKSKT
jgi:hypothetical protein